MRGALALLLLCSCASTSDGLVPIVDVPPLDSDAYPYAAVDTLELSIARAGDEEALALVSAKLDEDLTLDGIPFGDDLVVHLSGRAGGVEIAYGRTCALDIAPDSPTLEPHLFFSRLVRWGRGPDLQGAQTAGVLSVAIPNSALVLLIGAEMIGLVDALSLGREDGLSSTLTASLLPREGGTLTAFAKGALLVGGQAPGGPLVSTAELILPSEVNPDNQVLAIAGPAVIDHASIDLQNGAVLLTGGRIRESSGAPLLVSSAAHLFTESSSELAWRQLDPGLLQARAGHSMTRLGNEIGADVLILGGVDDANQVVTSVELFRPLRTAFEAVESAQMLVPRFNHKAVRLPGGFILVVGGEIPGASFQPVRQLELYDPVQGVFADAGTLPSGAGVVGMSVTELPDGRFMLAGGLDIDGEPVSTVLIARFDPIDGVVDLSPTDSMQTARAHHSATLLCDGTLMVAGGTSQASNETERYNPPSSGRR